MANYTLEEKDSFTVLGIGIELKSDYTDYAGINKEKAAFWQAVKQDGTLDTLKAIAENDYIFAVNEAVNNKMMHYAGVMRRPRYRKQPGLFNFLRGNTWLLKGKGRRLMS
ncbi:hypothetical protein HMSSN036_01480 [Paenibacillus macerans]|nr:hypothetical protein HMSSN036_01480 [Paenibacillus macerans]